MQGLTDYTLAKRAVLSALRRGIVDHQDVCDAHPELLRAARNIGELSGDPCPVCDSDSLRHVRYVFGDELKQWSGRPVYPTGWDADLAATHEEFRCYSIEVCIDCRWNHLQACWLMGTRYERAAKRRRKGKESAR